jgi:REP element-mobilizing transposase RayT
MITAMPRPLRVEYPGAIYHVMSRGNRQKDIYLDDVDRQDFLKTLAEACQKTGFEIHAYCLMRNHFHLVVETPNGEPGRRNALAGGDGRAVEARNDFDDSGNRPAIAHGKLEKPEQPAIFGR